MLMQIFLRLRRIPLIDHIFSISWLSREAERHGSAAGASTASPDRLKRPVRFPIGSQGCHICYNPP